MANVLQIREIQRYHRHLQRAGRAGTLDETARVWIRRYARLWRSRFEACPSST
jgi:hypothetical protein